MNFIQCYDMQGTLPSIDRALLCRPVNTSLGDAVLCGSSRATCDGHCEAAGGCEHACDFVSY